MSVNSILVDKKDGIAMVTINRPEVRNALDTAAWQRLRAVIAELDYDDDVRVIIITGAGEKAFIAGADLNALKVRSSVETFYSQNGDCIEAIENVSKATIAMVNGFCLGGGLEVALGCDIRMASDDAKFGQTELNVGILPGFGGTQRLPRAVGLAKAKELIFTGKIISAAEAEKIGLVNHVVPKAELLAETMKLAASIAAKSAIGVKSAKLAVNKGYDGPLATGLKLEKFAQSFMFSTEDHLEGINAFLEKRPPQFSNK
jgi:enoyl-CoA hydratase